MQEKQEETQQNCARGSCSKGFKTMCGGQALIEGIMMRGPKKESVVVRRPDGGLEIQERELRFIRDRYPVLGWPLIRGVVNFGGSMYSGVKALMYSVEFFPEDGEAEEEEPSKFEVWLESRLGSEKAASFFLTLAVILGVGMSIGLFFLLPTLLGTAVTLFTDSMLVRNVAESLLKIVIFVGYLVLCSRMKDIHRVFQYHGAEHKTIFCYEAGLPLTAPSPMRHQLPVHGDRHLHPGVHRGVRHLAGAQPDPALPGPSGHAAPDRGHQLRVQPLGRTARRPHHPHPGGPGPVAAELHYL